MNTNSKKGWDFIKEHFPLKDQESIEGFRKFAPDFVEAATVEYAFGNLWHRKIFDNKAREMIVLTTLITQGCVDDQLRFHIRLALQFGLTTDEIKEIALLLSAYIGIPRAIKSLAIMKEVFEAQGII